MNEHQLTGRPAPEALAALGTLRETVAALRNLQHLVISREVGTHVLDQVMPDVAASLASWAQSTLGLISFVHHHLQLKNSSLDEYKQHASQAAHPFILVLNNALAQPIRAKQRLAIERCLSDSLENILANLAEMELMVEASCSPGIPMSVAELLSSAPDKGSERPHRRVLIAGPIENLGVAISARLYLKCLGVLATLLNVELGQLRQLHVYKKDDHIFFRFEVTSVEGNSIMLPIYPSSEYTRLTVGSAIHAYGGQMLEEGLGFTLPAHLVPPASSENTL